MDSLAGAFKALWNEKKPFVFFRLPNKKDVRLFYQDNQELHHTSDFSENGFVFAPFKKRNQLPFIPSLKNKTYPSPKARIDPNTKKFEQGEQAKKKFLDLVDLSKTYLSDKKAQKIVVSRKITMPTSNSLDQILFNLLHLYANAMVYFWHHPKVGVWFGASPEILFFQKGEEFQTMALAATQVVNKENRYFWTPKERKEQALVTEQIQKDLLSFFSKTELNISESSPKKAGNVVHLCTHIKADQKNLKVRELIDALHPTPAVGGIPKREALQFINSEEGYDRQFYTGYLGPFSPNSTELFVNLRCAEYSNQQLSFFVGAGITEESEPMMEWEETQRKAETLLAAL